MKPSEKVKIFLEQLDTRLRDLERTDHVTRTAYGVGQHPQTDKPALPEFDDEEDILDFCKDLSSRLMEVENYRNPQMLHNKVQYQFELIETMADTMSQVMQKLKSFDFDERFIELFSDDDIRNYYTLSGLTATDVKRFIDKLEKSDVSMKTISLYVNGKLTDLKIRGLLGNYLKHEALKKTKKNNKAS